MRDRTGAAWAAFLFIWSNIKDDILTGGSFFDIKRGAFGSFPFPCFLQESEREAATRLNHVGQPQTSRAIGTTRTPLRTTFLARQVNRSLKVEIDNDGKIYLSPDTTLEDGRWLLSRKDVEVGFFDVVKGVVGVAHLGAQHSELHINIIFEGVPSSIRRVFEGLLDQILDRRGEKERQSGEVKIAEMLEQELSFTEATILLLDGKAEPCPGCGRIHTIDEINIIGFPPEAMRDILLKVVEIFRKWVLKEKIEKRLDNLVEGTDNDAVSKSGYDNRLDALVHLNRIKAIFAWQPAATPAPATPTAEPVGENAQR